jgi:hypothetical protein
MDAPALPMPSSERVPLDSPPMSTIPSKATKIVTIKTAIKPRIRPYSTSPWPDLCRLIIGYSGMMPFPKSMHGFRIFLHKAVRKPFGFPILPSLHETPSTFVYRPLNDTFPHLDLRRAASPPPFPPYALTESSHDISCISCPFSRYLWFCFQHAAEHRRRRPITVRLRTPESRRPPRPAP